MNHSCKHMYGIRKHCLSTIHNFLAGSYVAQAGLKITVAENYFEFLIFLLLILTGAGIIDVYQNPLFFNGVLEIKPRASCERKAFYQVSYISCCTYCTVLKE